MIRLNVFVQVEEKNREKVLEAAKELTVASAKEEGCIAYDIFESVTRPNIFIICETWKDQESLSLHEKTPHFVKNIVVLQENAAIKLEKFDM